MQYRKKLALTEATQWLKHGDHPQTQPLPPPDRFQEISESPYCSICGNLMVRHGLLDGANGEEIVCPGDYIVNDRQGLPYRLNRDEFESQYEPYVRPPSFTQTPISDLEERKRRRQPHKT
jgi:hypothetical protein